jgi:hypothetical protein
VDDLLTHTVALVALAGNGDLQVSRLDPAEREYTAVQRGVLVMYWLMLGFRLRTRDVARLTGMSQRGAFDLLVNMSVSVPIYEEHGEWQVCDDIMRNRRNAAPTVGYDE